MDDCDHEYEVTQNHNEDGSYFWTEEVCIYCDAVREYDE